MTDIVEEIDSGLRCNLDGAIGGTYHLPDGREFWMDAAAVREVLARIEPVIASWLEAHTTPRAADEVMASSDGEVGAKMRKVRGYSFNGEVRATFTNRAGEQRFVCELEGENGGGMLHIFVPDQIEVTQPLVHGPAQAQSHSPPLSD